VCDAGVSETRGVLSLLDTGRTVLLTWVCMLAVAHPLSNFRNNLHVMSNTLVCAELKVINSTAKLVKLALSPINGRCTAHASLARQRRCGLLPGYCGHLLDIHRSKFSGMLDGLRNFGDTLISNVTVGYRSCLCL